MAIAVGMIAITTASSGRVSFPCGWRAALPWLTSTHSSAPAPTGSAATA
jgi:hypothetical protein